MCINTCTGIYISVCITRWWNVWDTGLGTLWGCMDELLMLLSIYFPNHRNQNHMRIKTTIMRWCLLSHELIYKVIEGSTEFEDLIEKGLLTPHEQMLLYNQSAKPAMCWTWIASYLACINESQFEDIHISNPSSNVKNTNGTDAKSQGSKNNVKSGNIDEKKLKNKVGNEFERCKQFVNVSMPYDKNITLYRLLSICTKARAGIGTTFGYLMVQLPFRVIHFMSFLVWFHNVWQAIISSFAMIQYYQTKYYLRFVIELFYLAMYPMIFVAILYTCEHLLNPIRGKDCSDLPTKLFTLQMRDEMESFIRAGEFPPHVMFPEEYGISQNTVDKTAKHVSKKQHQ